jgi:hypothetical protein
MDIDKVVEELKVNGSWIVSIDFEKGEVRTSDGDCEGYGKRASEIFFCSPDMYDAVADQVMRGYLKIKVTRRRRK